MPGTVPVPDFAGQHKDAKVALQALAGLIIRDQKEHFEGWHKNGSDSDSSNGGYEMEIDHDVREIDDEEEEFIKTEPTLLPTLKKELARVNSCKDGFSALPPFVIDQLARYGEEHGKDLKLSLSNQMIISVKNGMSSVALADPMG